MALDRPVKIPERSRNLWATPAAVEEQGASKAGTGLSLDKIRSDGWSSTNTRLAPPMLDVPGRAIAAGNVTLVRCRELSRESRIAPQRFAGDREDERPRLRRAADVAVVETTEEG